MRVAINEAILLRGTSGSARATRYLREAIESMEGATVIGVRPSRTTRTRSRMINAARDAWWDLIAAPRAAPEADIFVSPCNIGRGRRGQPHLLVVYDVMLWESSHLFDPAFGVYARRLIKYSLRRATRTLTLSDHARQTLLRLVPGAEIHVVPLPGHRGRVTQARWPAGRLWVLMVGETAPHKNHATAIAAVDELRRRSGLDVGLRLIGPAGRAEDEVSMALRARDPSGEWTVRQSSLTDQELDQAYAHAWLLLQPSFDEGYGLPLVESAQRGLPALHSGRGGMASVLPDASVGSTETGAFLPRMDALLDKQQWEEAGATARADAERFSWVRFEAAVAEHLAVLVGSMGRGGVRSR
jgi:glycosyltransferase involved in cell wall biosynthesis